MNTGSEVRETSINSLTSEARALEARSLESLTVGEYFALTVQYKKVRNAIAVLRTLEVQETDTLILTDEDLEIIS